MYPGPDQCGRVLLNNEKTRKIIIKGKPARSRNRKLSLEMNLTFLILNK